MANYLPGELDQLIDLHRETITPNATGGGSLSWTLIQTNLWAHARHISGREADKFDKLNAEAACLFVIRYRDDIQENDRITWRGEFYNIRVIQKNGSRKLYLELYAERGVAQ